MTITRSKPVQGESTLDRLVRPFGITAAAILTGMAGFQTALALGAPSARMWAGR